MCVSLVSYIPKNRFARRFKYGVKCDGEFDCAKTCSQMSAVSQTNREDSLTNLYSHLQKLVGAQGMKVRRRRR
jgi:hypothetical protein